MPVKRLELTIKLLEMPCTEMTPGSTFGGLLSIPNIGDLTLNVFPKTYMRGVPGPNR